MGKAGQPACSLTRNTEWAAYTLKTGTKWVCESQARFLTVANILQVGSQAIPGREEISAKTEHQVHKQWTSRRKGQAIQNSRMEQWVGKESRFLPSRLVFPPPPPSVSCSMKYRSVSPTQLQVPQGYLGTQKAFSKCWLSEQMKKLKKKKKVYLLTFDVYQLLTHSLSNPPQPHIPGKYLTLYSKISEI